MLRRAFTIAAGTLCGSVVAFTVIQTAAGWGLWPNRELDRSSSYVRQVLEIVGENYVDPEKAAYGELTKSALHGLLSSLDPHSDFLEAKQYRELEEDMNAEFGGIGVQVEVRKEKVVVIAPIAGTPGDRAGIQRGDAIVAVDGQELGRASMSDVISRLRGRPGTEVTVRLFRPSTQRDVEFLVRVVRIGRVGQLVGGAVLMHQPAHLARMAHEVGRKLGGDDQVHRPAIALAQVEQTPGGGVRQQFVLRVPLEGHRHAIGLEAPAAQFIDELLDEQFGAPADERNLSFADKDGANGHRLCKNATANCITHQEWRK
jgi:hypothetical protein